MRTYNLHKSKNNNRTVKSVPEATLRKILCANYEELKLQFWTECSWLYEEHMV